MLANAAKDVEMLAAASLSKKSSLSRQDASRERTLQIMEDRQLGRLAPPFSVVDHAKSPLRIFDEKAIQQMLKETSPDAIDTANIASTIVGEMVEGDGVASINLQDRRDNQ